MNLSRIFAKKEDNKKVIIADDVATIRTISGSVFKKANYQILEARNGDEVLTLARAHKPNLIVLDLQMGNRSGISAIDELLLDDDLKHIPIVVLSGEDDPNTIKQIKAYANVRDYIIKSHLPNVIESLKKHV